MKYLFSLLLSFCLVSPLFGADDLLANGNFDFDSWSWRRDSSMHTTANPKVNAGYLEKPEFDGNSMRLKPGISMNSESFDVEPGADYTLLVRMKNAAGKTGGNSALYLVNPFWKFQRFECAPGNEYKTYKVKGRFPRHPFNIAYARIDSGDNDLIVDRVAVVKGDANDFPPLFERRAGLIGRNLFDVSEKDPALTLKAVSPEPLEVVWTVRAVTGEAVKTGTVTVDHTAKLPLPNPGQRGVFLLELGWKCGKAQFRYATVRDLSGKTLPDTPVAGHFFPLNFHYRELFRKYLSYDGSFNRFFMAEDHPVCDTPEGTNALAGAESRLVVTMYAPDFRHSGVGLPSPEEKVAFEKNAEQYFRDIREACYAVEIFNEPNLWKITVPGTDYGKPSMDVPRYLEFLKIARAVRDRVAPNLKLAGPCSNQLAGTYVDDFIKAGGLKLIDVFTFHGYCENPDAYDLAGKVDALRKRIVAERGQEIPIWNTEQFYGVRLNRLQHFSEYSRNEMYKDSEPEQAILYCQALLHSAAAAAPLALFWSQIQVIDGTLSEPLVFPTAAFAAINASVELLGDAGRGENVGLDGGIRAFYFPKKNMAALYSRNGDTGSLILPAGAAAFDLYGNPLTGGTVPLGSAPVYVFLGNAKWNQLKFSGFGSPLRTELQMTGGRELRLSIENRRAFRQEFSIAVKELPQGWAAAQTEFTGTVEPLAVRELTIPLTRADLDGFNVRTFRIRIAAAGESEVKTFRLAILPVPYSQTLTVEPANLHELGEANLSENHSPLLKWAGDSDLSAKFGAVWNEKGLMLHFDVTDDVFDPPRHLREIWSRDSIQLYFDMPGNKSAYYDIGLLNGTPTAYLGMAVGDRYIGEQNAATGVDSAVTSRISRRGTVTTYEIFFGKEALYAVKFVPGSGFKFNLLVNDNDGKGRKTGLSLAPPGKEPFQHPEYSKDMILIR